MKVQKWELANKIRKLRTVVPKQTSVPILQNILVEDGRLTATNMELTVSTTFQDSEGETMLIPVKAFGLIDQLPSGELEISSRKRNGRNGIMIRSGTAIKNVFETMDPAEFPRGGVYDSGENEATINGEELAGAIRNVLYAVAKTSAKQNMCAVCMECNGEALTFTGLNGQQVAQDWIPYAEAPFRLLIPRSAAEQLISLGLEGDVIINYSSVYASFQSDEYMVQTRLVEGEYFNVGKLFREEGYLVELMREPFSKAVRRADMCNEDSNPVPVRIDLEGDSLKVYIQSSAAAYSETLPINTDVGEKMTIGFNPALLRTTMESFGDEKVDAFFISPKMPLIVRSKTSQLRALLLPVMVR